MSTVAEYEEVGHIFRPGLLSAEEVATINDELDKIVADGQRPGLVLEKDERTLRSVFNPHLYSNVLARLVRHPRVLGAVEDLLGEPVYVFQLVVNNKAPFNGDMWYWHQDYPTYRADDHIPECRMVNVLIFLDEVTQFNGPLMVVPGSHRMESEWPDESTQGTSYKIRYSGTGVIEAEVQRGGIVAPTGPAGSVMFMHPNVLHGSGSNLSPWRRRLISLTYNALSNKATTPTTRSRDIVPDDSTVPALEALRDDCLLVGAAEV
jgi:L-proline 4-hydroxylase